MEVASNYFLNCCNAIVFFAGEERPNTASSHPTATSTCAALVNVVSVGLTG